jgi:hypothetical protein
MCPVTTFGLAAAALAVSTVSSVAAIGTSVMETKKQNEAHSENGRAALDAYIMETSRTNRRISQENTATGQKRQATDVKRMSTKGKSFAGAAAGGVTGQSVDELMSDYNRGAVAHKRSLSLSNDNRTDQLDNSKDGARATSDSRIRSVAPVGMEKIFGATVDAGAQMFGAYSDFKVATTPKD